MTVLLVLLAICVPPVVGPIKDHCDCMIVATVRDHAGGLLNDHVVFADWSFESDRMELVESRILADYCDGRRAEKRPSPHYDHSRRAWVFRWQDYGTWREVRAVSLMECSIEQGRYGRWHDMPKSERSLSRPSQETHWWE